MVIQTISKNKYEQSLHLLSGTLLNNLDSQSYGNQKEKYKALVRVFAISKQSSNDERNDVSDDD